MKKTLDQLIATPASAKRENRTMPAKHKRAAARVSKKIGKEVKPKTTKPQEALWEAFVRNYVLTMDAMGAYRSVYGTHPWSTDQNGLARLLANPEVQNAVAEQMKPAIERMGLSKDFALRRLIEEIEANQLDFVHPNGTLMTLADLKSLPLSKQRLIDHYELVLDPSYKLAMLEWAAACKAADAAETERPVQPEPTYMAQTFLIDKQKALVSLAKIQGWINTKDTAPTVDLGDFIAMLTEANERVSSRMAEVRMKMAESRSFKQLERAPR